MKILYDYEILIIQEYGGVSRYHYELAKRMRNNEIVDLPVIFPRNYYFSEYLKRKKFKYKNQYLKYFIRKINALLTFIILTVNYIKGTPYDIVHSTFYNPDYIYPYYALVDKKHRTKYVITIHDMVQEMEADKSQNMKRSAKAKKKALSVADGVISISENTKKDLNNYYPFIRGKNIEVIYHGKDKVELKDNISTKPLFNGEYMLFVGQRVARKNFQRVLDAFSEVKTDYPRLHLVCTGGGTFTEEETKKISELNMTEFVHQSFYEDKDLFSLYFHALFLVFPSFYEGFGFPILEAWSCGCPIILSNASCFPEIGGDAALYFEAKNTDELTGAMKKLIESESLRRVLREKGKERLKSFSWDKSFWETKEFYKQLLMS